MRDPAIATSYAQNLDLFSVIVLLIFRMADHPVYDSAGRTFLIFEVGRKIFFDVGNTIVFFADVD